MGCSQSKGTAGAVNTVKHAAPSAPAPVTAPVKPKSVEKPSAPAAAPAVAAKPKSEATTESEVSSAPAAAAAPPPPAPAPAAAPAAAAPKPPKAAQDGGTPAVAQLPPKPPTTPTKPPAATEDDDSMDGSAHSTCSSRSTSSRRSGRTDMADRNMNLSHSALKLDEMIDDQRNALTMAERVVHIEVPFGKPIEEVYNGVHDGPVLGSGISGLVRLATHKATDIKYAVKCLDLGLVDNEEGLQQLREEIYIMCQLDHPNIVRLEEVYESHSEIYLVQELCTGGELFDRLDEQPDYHYTEAQCARLVKQMLCSVRYIHSKGIIHRDLKLENFLFSDESADSELKMIDFGLSKHFQFGDVQHEAVGTPYTVAPEVIRGSYDERCDVWAIGVITYLLLSGESPFGGCGGPEPLMEVKENILACNFEFEPDDIWEHVSEMAKKFITRLLMVDPKERPTARQTQVDPWLIEMADRVRKPDDKILNQSVVRALVNFKEYSDMRKLLCEVLSFTLIPDQIQGLRKEFEKMDTDGSGEISLAALKKVLIGNASQGSLGALSEEEVEDIFNAMRVSKSETTIHWHEFIAAGLSHCKVDERNLKLAFDRLDADHTGYITFENFMDLIGTGHSEDKLQEMWGEASLHNEGGRIGYEDFLLLMKGQTKPPPATSTPRTSGLQPVCENGDGMEESPPSPKATGVKLPETSPSTSFLQQAFEDAEETSSEGPICIDDGDDGMMNAGFAEAMQHQGNGVMIKESISKDKTAEVGIPRNIETDSSKERSHSLSETVKNEIPTSDKPKVKETIEFYKLHRQMRSAVLDGAKRLDEEQARRAREKMRKEQAMSNKIGAGLIMRHGGEVSANAIKQFVMEQQQEDKKMVEKATKRSGRRHNRSKTNSDIRGMFGSGGSLSDNSSTVPAKRDTPKMQGIPQFGQSRHTSIKVTVKEAKELVTLAPPAEEAPKVDVSGNVPKEVEVQKQPKIRTATKPGQFRQTTYDPFSFGMKSANDDGSNQMMPMDSSVHKHLEHAINPKKIIRAGGSHNSGLNSKPSIGKSGSDTEINSLR